MTETRVSKNTKTRSIRVSADYTLTNLVIKNSKMITLRFSMGFSILKISNPVSFLQYGTSKLLNCFACKRLGGQTFMRSLDSDPKNSRA